MDWNNKHEVLEKVREDGSNLCHASEELKNDPEVVKVALKQDWMFLEHYAGEKIKNDPKIIEFAIESAKDFLRERLEIFLNEGLPEKEIAVLQGDIDMVSKEIKIYQNRLAELQKDGHTPAKIVEGIEPTKTGMDKVAKEMVSEKVNPDKDEKPGQEPGDN